MSKAPQLRERTISPSHVESNDWKNGSMIYLFFHFFHFFHFFASLAMHSRRPSWVADAPVPSAGSGSSSDPETNRLPTFLPRSHARPSLPSAETSAQSRMEGCTAFHIPLRGRWPRKEAGSSHHTAGLPAGLPHLRPLPREALFRPSPGIHSHSSHDSTCCETRIQTHSERIATKDTEAGGLAAEATAITLPFPRSSSGSHLPSRGGVGLRLADSDAVGAELPFLRRHCGNHSRIFRSSGRELSSSSPSSSFLLDSG